MIGGQQSTGPKVLVETVMYSPRLAILPKHLGGGGSIDSRSSSSESSARLRDVSMRSSRSSSAGMMLTLRPRAARVASAEYPGDR